MTTPIGREALIPNNRIAAFSPFIGVWTSVGHHTMMPGVTLHGRLQFEWHEQGAFVCVRTDVDEPNVPSAVAMVGSDDHSENLAMLYFDERNVSRRFEIAVQGMSLKWWRNAAKFSQRFELTIAADGKSMRGESFLCQDDVNWERDMTVEYTRAG